MNPKILVIGLGNPLREDDGIGAEVVEILEKRMAPATREKVTLLAGHQVDLIQAAIIKDYDKVIFVDAQTGMSSQPVQIKKMTPANDAPTFTSHIGSIPVLLSITERVFGQVPDCYLVAVQGSDFAFEHSLSAAGKNNAALGAQAIIDLTNESLPLE